MYIIKIVKILIILIILLILGVNISGNYIQNQNINKLLDQNLDGRLIPHKANYINKLHNILNDNYTTPRKTNNFF